MKHFLRLLARWHIDPLKFLVKNNHINPCDSSGLFTSCLYRCSHRSVSHLFDGRVVASRIFDYTSQLKVKELQMAAAEVAPESCVEELRIDSALEEAGKEKPADGFQDFIRTCECDEGNVVVVEVAGFDAKTGKSILEFDGRSKQTTDSLPEVLSRTEVGTECLVKDVVTTETVDLGDGTSAPNESSDSKSGLRVPLREKRGQFRAKLASNLTILPTELLCKVTDLVSRCPSSASALSVAAEFFDEHQAECSAASAVVNPEDAGRHEMEDLLMSFFKEEVEAPAIKQKKTKEEKKTLGDKKDRQKPRKVAPSHFIAIQVTDSEIHKKIGEIQTMAVAQKSLLREALVNLPTLHLTLMVMFLKDEEQTERAKAALEECKARILERGYGCLALPFAGVGDFNGKVVFAKVRDGPELDQLKEVAAIVRRSFANEEIVSTDERDFEAHLTIMKLSKSPWLFKKIRQINSSFYASVKDDFMGTQPVLGLQLCAMERDEGGYYRIDHEVIFVEPSEVILEEKEME